MGLRNVFLVFLDPLTIAMFLVRQCLAVKRGFIHLICTKKIKICMATLSAQRKHEISIEALDLCDLWPLSIRDHNSRSTGPRFPYKVGFVYINLHDN